MPRPAREADRRRTEGAVSARFATTKVSPETVIFCPQGCIWVRVADEKALRATLAPPRKCRNSELTKRKRRFTGMSTPGGPMLNPVEQSHGERATSLGESGFRRLRYSADAR